MVICNRFKRTIIFSCASICVALSLTGCISMGQKGESMQSALAAGRVGNALEIAEKEDLQQEDVLASMNKGMLRRIKGDYQGSNQVFEIAKQQIEDLYGVSVSEQAGALIVNDSLRSYSGDRYEQVLLHAYMAMNYIQLDNLDAARVEMMQANVKMQEWGEQPEEDPFVRYLSGMIYESLDETDQALVAYRQAKDAYQATKEKQNLEIPTVLKKDLLRVLAEEGHSDELRVLKKEFNMKQHKTEKMPRGYGELIVVLNSGLAPVRKGVSIIANTGKEVVDTVKISVPRYQKPKRRFSARLKTDKNISANLDLVEDVDALARAALSSDMPVITARAIARAVVKHQTQDKAKEKGGALAGWLATAVNVASEQADTRSWITLPQTIQLARVKLPKGLNKVSINIHGESGALVDTIQKEVDIKSGKSVFLTEHWVVPNMMLTVVTGKK